MKRIYTIGKFYGLGLAVSTAIAFVVHVHGYFFDSFYAFQSVSITAKGIVLCSFFMGFNFWVIAKSFAQINLPLWQKRLCNAWLFCLLVMLLLLIVEEHC